jgi:hypothetical protein
MDDVKKPQQPTQVPVMDIQSTQPVHEESIPVDQVPSETAVSPEPAPTLEPAATAVEEAPAQATTPALAAVAVPHKSHRKPILAVLCAVIVAGVFSTLAIMSFMSNDAKQPAATSRQPNNTVQTDAASTTDVDETDKAIDSSLSSIDDTADYGDASVSDTTLGL